MTPTELRNELGMNYLSPSHARTLKAMRVCQELQQWLEGSEAGTHFYAALTVSTGMVSIEIAGQCLWDSENCDEEELHTEVIKAMFHSHVMDQLGPFKAAIARATEPTK